MGLFLMKKETERGVFAAKRPIFLKLQLFYTILYIAYLFPNETPIQEIVDSGLDAESDSDWLHSHI